jgi:hypothetical protein
MKFGVLFILIFSFSQSLFCQQNDYVQKVIDEHFSPPEISGLSQSQMYADFDTLEYLLKNVYPFYHIKSTLNATNYDERLKELRSQISKIEQTEDFIWILQKAINLFCDRHLGILSLQAIKNHHKYNITPDFIFTPENIVCTYKYYLLTHDSLYFKIKTGLSLKYLDGDYYTIRPFRYKNQIFTEGSLLKSINGTPVDTFVNRHYMSIFGAVYDYKNKKYFSDYLLVSPDFLNQKSYVLTFEDDKKNILQDTFHVDIQVEGVLERYIRQYDFNPAVFTVQDSILYVRMPDMSGNDDFYISEIQKLYNVENIQKIVIDVRQNPGGSDMVWMNVLSHIISDTIRQNVSIYAPNTSKIVRDYLVERNRKRNKSDSLEIEHLPFLNAKLIKVYKAQETIAPKESSIRFTGKIIIMQDENTFSAAGSLVSVANENDNMISIGNGITDLGGRGIGSLLYQLPYTNMLITIPIVVDCSNVKQMSDFLKGVPEIECEQSFSEYLKYFYSKNPYQSEFLLEDECFLKAISL